MFIVHFIVEILRNGTEIPGEKDWQEGGRGVPGSSGKHMEI